MGLFRMALEDDNVGDMQVEMKGPLSEVYANALAIAYDKNVDVGTPPADNETPLNPNTPVTQEADIALEANSADKKKKMKLKVKKGSFHDWLGKKPDEHITDADIEKGLKSKDPHVKKMAQFAKNAKKWQHKKKLATESFTGIAIESIMSEFTTALETQEMDQEILTKLQESIIESGSAEGNISPTDSFQTVYGVARNDVDEDTVVDVVSELANVPEESNVVLILDACNPSIGGDVGGEEEKIVELNEALETIALCHGAKVYHSFSEYLNSRK